MFVNLLQDGTYPSRDENKSILYREGGQRYRLYEGQEESPLEDTASHAPAISTQAGHEESTGPQVTQAPGKTYLKC